MDKAIVPKVVTKTIKHVLTDEEKLKLGSELSNAIRTQRVIESEFDQVKASFKSRLAEQEAIVARISTDISNGWDMRPTRCTVVMFPKEGIKRFYSEGDFMGDAIHSEQMNPEDYQTEMEVGA